MEASQSLTHSTISIRRTPTKRVTEIAWPWAKVGFAAIRRQNLIPWRWDVHKPQTTERSHWRLQKQIHRRWKNQGRPWPPRSSIPENTMVKWRRNQRAALSYAVTLTFPLLIQSCWDAAGNLTIIGKASPFLLKRLVVVGDGLILSLAVATLRFDIWCRNTRSAFGWGLAKSGVE